MIFKIRFMAKTIGFIILPETKIIKSVDGDVLFARKLRVSK